MIWFRPFGRADKTPADKNAKQVKKKNYCCGMQPANLKLLMKTSIVPETSRSIG